MKYQDILEYTPKKKKSPSDLRAKIEADVKAEGYTDLDTIEFKVDERLGLLKKEAFNESL